MTTHLTVGQLADLFGLPAWKVRRAVDSLGGEIPRAGMYRMVPRSRIGDLTALLHKRGWLAEAQVAEAAS